jgi:hypothetical protein
MILSPGQSRGRRLLVVAVVMVVVVAAAELGARLLSPYVAEPLVWADESTRVKVAQMEARGCADLVVLGNSMARDDIHPDRLREALGVSVYNAALDAAGPDLLARWANEEVEPRLSPDTVVLALSSADLNDQSAAGRAAAEAYGSSVMGRDDVVGRIGAWATEHSDLVRYRTELRQPAQLWGALRRAAAGDEVDRSDESSPLLGPDGEGLTRRDLVFDGESVSATFARTQLLNDFSAGGTQLESARALVTHLQADGVNVVVVVLPVTDEYRALHPHPDADMARFRVAVDDLATDTGADLVDFLDTPYRDDLFADTHHLNAAGGTRLTDELARELDALPEGTCDA